MPSLKPRPNPHPHAHWLLRASLRSSCSLQVPLKLQVLLKNLKGEKLFSASSPSERRSLARPCWCGIHHIKSQRLHDCYTLRWGYVFDYIDMEYSEDKNSLTTAVISHSKPGQLTRRVIYRLLMWMSIFKERKKDNSFSCQFCLQSTFSALSKCSHFANITNNIIFRAFLLMCTVHTSGCRKQRVRVKHSVTE